MAKIAQNYTNTRNSQYTQQSLFCNKIGIKIKETCVILIVVNHIKVSKFRKQIFLLSFEPKNERNYFLISALASNNGSNQKSEGTLLGIHIN